LSLIDIICDTDLLRLANNDFAFQRIC
jgi:hypothetical protein